MWNVSERSTIQDFFSPLSGANRTRPCDVQLSGVDTWLSALGRKTQNMWQRGENKAASVPQVSSSDWNTVSDVNKHNYIGDILQEDLIWLWLFVVLFAMLAASQFFIVAGPSVSAVKHSSVFSCDWDSLEEESVRHGAWLSVCWSFSRGLEEIGRWRRRQGRAKPPSSTSPLQSSRPVLSPSFAPPLSPPFSSPSCLPSLSGGSLLVIHWSPLSVPRQPPSPGQALNNNTQPLDQSSKRADSLIDAYQRIHSYWPVFPIPVIICTAPTASLLLYCVETLLARYCFLLQSKQYLIISHGTRCTRQPWQTSLTIPNLSFSNVVSNPPWWSPQTYRHHSDWHRNLNTWGNCFLNFDLISSNFTTFQVPAQKTKQVKSSGLNESMKEGKQKPPSR